MVAVNSKAKPGRGKRSGAGGNRAGLAQQGEGQRQAVVHALKDTGGALNTTVTGVSSAAGRPTLLEPGTARPHAV